MKNYLLRIGFWLTLAAALAFAALNAPMCFGQTNTPIHHGLLQDSLNGNGQSITNAGSISAGQAVFNSTVGPTLLVTNQGGAGNDLIDWHNTTGAIGFVDRNGNLQTSGSGTFGAGVSLSGGAFGGSGAGLTALPSFAMTTNASGSPPVTYSPYQFINGFTYGDPNAMAAGVGTQAIDYFAGNASDKTVSGNVVDYGRQLVSMNNFSRVTISLACVGTNVALGTLVGTNGLGQNLYANLNAGSLVLENAQGITNNCPAVCALGNNGATPGGHTMIFTSFDPLGLGQQGDYMWFYTDFKTRLCGTPHWDTNLFTNIFNNSMLGSNYAGPWSLSVNPVTDAVAVRSNLTFGGTLYGAAGGSQLTTTGGQYLNGSAMNPTGNVSVTTGNMSATNFISSTRNAFNNGPVGFDAGGGNGSGMNYSVESHGIVAVELGVVGTPVVTIVPTGGGYLTGPTMTVGSACTNEGDLSGFATFQIQGTLALAQTTRTSAYSLNDTNSVVYLNGTTAAANTVTLPDATVKCAGRIYTIKIITSSATGVITNATGSQTIDGVLSTNLTAKNKYITVQSDGSNWQIIANN